MLSKFQCGCGYTTAMQSPQYIRCMTCRSVSQMFFIELFTIPAFGESKIKCTFILLPKINASTQINQLAEKIMSSQKKIELEPSKSCTTWHSSAQAMRRQRFCSNSFFVVVVIVQNEIPPDIFPLHTMITNRATNSCENTENAACAQEGQ